MSRCHASALLLSFVALAPAAARAAPDCPDGWFCEDGAAPQAPPPSRPERPAPRPAGSPADESPPFEPPSYPPPGPPGPPGPADEPVIFLDQPETAPPVRRPRRPFHEWGFNLHLEAAILGHQHERSSRSEMTGLGFAFRYRPLPSLAFEAGVDLLAGIDYQGYSRDEAGLLFNTLVFFNPRDIVQVYALAGIGFSRADVTIAPRAEDTWFPRHDEHYSYFGGQLGLGFEVRVSRSIALAADLLGFVRGRTDDLADVQPEFVDRDTHRATNTSGGGLVRLGASFYW